jgi:hypothetical protein
MRVRIPKEMTRCMKNLWSMKNRRIKKMWNKKKWRSLVVNPMLRGWLELVWWRNRAQLDRLKVSRY